MAEAGKRVKDADDWLFGTERKRLLLVEVVLHAGRAPWRPPLLAEAVGGTNRTGWERQHLQHLEQLGLVRRRADELLEVGPNAQLADNIRVVLRQLGQDLGKDYSPMYPQDESPG